MFNNAKICIIPNIKKHANWRPAKASHVYNIFPSQAIPMNPGSIEDGEYNFQNARNLWSCKISLDTDEVAIWRFPVHWKTFIIHHSWYKSWDLTKRSRIWDFKFQVMCSGTYVRRIASILFHSLWYCKPPYSELVMLDWMDSVDPEKSTNVLASHRLSHEDAQSNSVEDGP